MGACLLKGVLKFVTATKLECSSQHCHRLLVSILFLEAEVSCTRALPLQHLDLSIFACTISAASIAICWKIECSPAGSLRSCNPDRVVLKKITLSGYPVKVHKKKAVVRWMFHSPDDVRWFRPLELWTKHGRRGRIKVS